MYYFYPCLIIVIVQDWVFKFQLGLFRYFFFFIFMLYFAPERKVLVLGKRVRHLSAFSDPSIVYLLKDHINESHKYCGPLTSLATNDKTIFYLLTIKALHFKL